MGLPENCDKETPMLKKMLKIENTFRASGSCTCISIVSRSPHKRLSTISSINAASCFFYLQMVDINNVLALEADWSTLTFTCLNMELYHTGFSSSHSPLFLVIFNRIIIILFWWLNCYNEWGRWDLNPGFTHKGAQAMLLSYKALGIFILWSCEKFSAFNFHS